MTDKVEFSKVSFSYIDPKSGKKQTTKLNVQKGMVLDFKNPDGSDNNSYKINEKGQIVSSLNPNKILKEIETIQSEVQRYKKMAVEVHDGGLTKQDAEHLQLREIRHRISDKLNDK